MGHHRRRTPASCYLRSRLSAWPHQRTKQQKARPRASRSEGGRLSPALPPRLDARPYAHPLCPPRQPLYDRRGPVWRPVITVDIRRASASAFTRGFARGSRVGFDGVPRRLSPARLAAYGVLASTRPGLRFVRVVGILNIPPPSV